MVLLCLFDVIVMVNVNIGLTGYAEQVVAEMINRGYAKTKTEALRLALFEFGQKHELVDEEEALSLMVGDILKKVDAGKIKVKKFDISKLDH